MQVDSECDNCAAPLGTQDGRAHLTASSIRLSASSLYRPQEWPWISVQVWLRPVDTPHSQQNDCRAGNTAC